MGHDAHGHRHGLGHEHENGNEQNDEHGTNAQTENNDEPLVVDGTLSSCSTIVEKNHFDM